MAAGIIDVTVPKLLGEAETRGKVENDIRVRPGFAGRRNDQNTAVGDVGHGGTRPAGADTAEAEGVARGKGAPPPADVEGDSRIRGAKGVDQRLDEATRGPRLPWWREMTA